MDISRMPDGPCVEALYTCMLKQTHAVRPPAMLTEVMYGLCTPDNNRYAFQSIDSLVFS